jgi:hypothetical protein
MGAARAGCEGICVLLVRQAYMRLGCRRAKWARLRLAKLGLPQASR